VRALLPGLFRAAALATAVVPAAACDVWQPEAAQRPTPPLELSGRVVDAAQVIPAEVESDLDRRLAAIERDTKAQVVVVSTPSLNGSSIEDYGLKLARGWGIGDVHRRDGVLLIVAPKERQVRIEVGYGLESTLKHGRCAIIIAEEILPRFREGDLVGGTVAGTVAIERLLRRQAEISA